MAAETDSRSRLHVGGRPRHNAGMSLTSRLAQYGGLRLSRRLGRSIPLLGVAVALFTLRGAIRRKGLLGGVADAALDATPGVGLAKNMYETVRGDVISDRAARPPRRRR